MKKLVILLVLVSLLRLPCLAQLLLQFPVSQILPGAIVADPYADSILNIPRILKKEAIKKITVCQDPFVQRGSYISKTEYINEEGNIYKTMLWFPNNKSNDSGFCLSDTFMYDAQHRVIEQISKDGINDIYIRAFTEYLHNGEVKHSFITFPKADTSVTYKYYNDKGQLIRSNLFMKELVLIDAYLYYNADGLIDSVQHKNSYWRTFVFKRIEKRKALQLEIDNIFTHYTWIYNPLGQCITTRLKIGKRPGTPGRPENKYASEIEVNYYYNADGTLSKTINKETGRPTVNMIYTYSK